MFVNSAVSQYPSLAFQFAFDQAGENFHTAALMLSGEDSGQATPLLSKEFVDDIMAGSFAIRQSKTILAFRCGVRMKS
jgi:hypothetical protein